MLVALQGAYFKLSFVPKEAVKARATATLSPQFTAPMKSSAAMNAACTFLSAARAPDSISSDAEISAETDSFSETTRDMEMEDLGPAQDMADTSSASPTYPVELLRRLCDILLGQGDHDVDIGDGLIRELGKPYLTSSGR